MYGDAKEGGFAAARVSSRHEVLLFYLLLRYFRRKYREFFWGICVSKYYKKKALLKEAPFFMRLKMWD